MSVKQDTDRNISIDVLRVIGTALVILAHVDIPEWLSLMRSFDVCLLVMISGVSYVYSNKRVSSYVHYVLKRIKRLCIPAYVAATAVFVTCLFLCLLVKRDYPYTLRQMVETYLFIGGRTGGIGYFWIVRIYLLMALIAPALKRISQLIKNNTGYILLLSGALLLNEGLFVLFYGKYGATCDFLVENYVMSLLAYSVVYMIGIRIGQDKKFMLPAIVFSVFGAITCQTYIAIFDSQYVVAEYKYPPQIAYIFLGLAASLLLWLFVEKIFERIRNKKIIWLSRQSFNIYLAHVFIMSLMSYGNKYLIQIPYMDKWMTRYIVIVGGSTLIVYCIDKLRLRKKGKRFRT